MPSHEPHAPRQVPPPGGRTAVVLETAEALRRTFAYHQRTKHHLDHYARSAGYLDWATEPDPFRTYAGAPQVDLPLLADAVTAGYDDMYMRGKVMPRRPDLHSIAILFELALGLSAWKQFKTSRWALRCNPSSGNLHPTEGYLVTPELPGLSAGAYHYVSRDHRLERRCTLDEPAQERLAALLPAGCFLLGLTSIHWREAWKYGERAFRYCQHDVGHALAGIRYAAACLGWSALLLDHLADHTVASILGLDQHDAFADVDTQDREHPDALLLVGPAAPSAVMLPDDLLAGCRWSGQANRLSNDHAAWPIIEEAAEATWKAATTPSAAPYRSLPPVLSSSAVSAARLIRQRRSAQAFDSRTSISAQRFFIMLDHLLPRAGVPPWDLLPWQPHLHLALFVHRIDGLPSGLYFLERNQTVHERIRRECRSSFAWANVPGCPEHLPLFFLQGADLRQSARVISCHQEIASDGAFSLGMIAEFAESIREHGPWWYRRLFWEAGIIGQVLYLEAEAASVRSTGIGCYFDDACHELLGFETDAFQSLYHFTVGGPVEDPRLQTTPPYAHLTGRCWGSE